MKIPEIKLSLKIEKVKKSELYKIVTSQQGYDLLLKVYDEDTLDWTEEAIILALNRCNKVLGFFRLSSGGVAGCIMDPKIVFTMALKLGASAIIVSHNHPSGNLHPSNQDNQITAKIVECGKILDVTVLDHIIVTDEGYYSYADEGKI